MRILGNLDCEARWAGIALPAAVQQRISLYAALLAAFADEPCEVWAPAAVDPARLLAPRGWTPPTMRVHDAADLSRDGQLRGDLSRAADAFDLAWADVAAREANDRGAALAIAERLGVGLPGVRIVGSLDELDAAARAVDGAWVCKARWTSAGRDRVHGAGIPVGEVRARLGGLFARFGTLVFEPWLERLVDAGISGTIGARGIELAPPHGLACTARGGFVGIDTGPPALTHVEREQLEATAHAAAVALSASYRGPFTIDAFVYTQRGERRLRPICEINARQTFGGVARALARRLGIQRLGFGEPPAGASVLIAPGADRVTAWCA